MTYDDMFDKVYMGPKAKVHLQLDDWQILLSRHQKVVNRVLYRDLHNVVSLSTELRLDISLKRQWQTEELWRSALSRRKQP